MAEREWTPEDQRDFDDSLEEFFDIAFKKVEAGEAPLSFVEGCLNSIRSINEAHEGKI